MVYFEVCVKIDLHNMDPCSGNGVVSGPAVTVNNQGNQKHVQTSRNFSDSKSLNIGFRCFDHKGYKNYTSGM